MNVSMKSPGGYAKLVSGLGPLGSLPVPFFGTVRQAVNFALHHGKKSGAARFAPWGATALGAGLWFVWPALTQDFKALAFGVGMTMEDEEKFIKAEEERLKENPNRAIDYSASGVLKTFKTRMGARHQFEEEEIDTTPMNKDSKALKAILAAQEEAKGAHEGGDLNKSVDALRRFNTRAGAEYIYESEEIDTTPKLAGDGDDDDEDEEGGGGGDDDDEDDDDDDDE